MTTTETAPQQRQYTEVRYDAVAIDRKWQERWNATGFTGSATTTRAPNGLR